MLEKGEIAEYKNLYNNATYFVINSQNKQLVRESNLLPQHIPDLIPPWVQSVT